MRHTISSAQSVLPGRSRLLTGLPFNSFVIGLLTLLTAPLRAQVTPPTGQNYVITQTPRIQATSVSMASSYGDVPATVSYVDGLGRPVQTVQVRGAGNAATDIIGQTSTYDAFGRVQRVYLPVPGVAATGAFLADPQAAGSTFYAGDQNPYAESVYETSPLNRPVQQFGAGQNWRTASRRVTTRYGVGAGVIRFKANAIAIFSNVPDQSPVEYFGPRDIATQTTLNEQLQTTIAYTDLQGHTIRRDVVLSAGDTLTTMYVYDNFERLTAVIPPKLYRWFTPANTVLLFRTGDVFSGPDNPIFTESAYVYLHDKRGRLVAKHVPNAGWTELVYDRQDRLVMSRDRQDNADGQWRFTKYDGLGRTVMSGRTSLPLSSTQSADDLRAGFAAMTVTDEDRSTATGNLLGYTQRSFPASVPTAASAVLTVNYYDNYAASTLAYQSPGSPFVAPYSSAAMGNATGLLTTSKTRTLINTGIVGNTTAEAGPFYESTFWYDDKGRVLQTQRQNHLGGTDRIDNQYNFSGELQVSAFQHQPGAGASTTTVTTSYGYDHLGRRTQTLHQVGNVGPTLLADYEYDAIGRLVDKRLGGGVVGASQQSGNWNAGLTWQGNTVPGVGAGVIVSAGHLVTIPANTTVGAAWLRYGPGGRLAFGPGGGGRLRLGFSGSGPAFLQRQTYHYHLRGWLRGINLDATNTPTTANGQYFAMRLGYDDGGEYGGNISSQTWVHSRDNLNRAYTYSYDAANRITGAFFGGGQSRQGFRLSNISYDANGNLQTLSRNLVISVNTSQGLDNLTYTYSPVGNSLTAVTDAVGGTDMGDFRDNNKTGPDYAYSSDGSLLYDSNRGINLIRYNLFKLPREVVSISGTKIASYTYSATGQKLRMSVAGEIRDYIGPFEYLNGSLFTIHTDEGRYTPTGGYEYFIKDHLGNVRVSFGSSGIVQYQDYDPLGLAMPALSGGASSNRLKYNGKEAVGEIGGGVYDYGARFYDAQIGRWGVVDPMAEMSRRFSPYVYGNNNPVNMIDPDGMISLPTSGYYQGQAAQDLFGQMEREERLSEQEEAADGGPGPKKRTQNPPQKGLVGTPPILSPSGTSPTVRIAPPIGASPLQIILFGALASGLSGDQSPTAPSASRYKRDAYIYREMSINSDGSFVQSPLIGAPNARQMGVRTPASVALGVTPDINPGGDNNNMVGPDYTGTMGLSASNPPRPTLYKGTRQGAVQISNLPFGLEAINDHASHYSIFPITNMTMSQYQSLLNSIPWKPYP